MFGMIGKNPKGRGAASGGPVTPDNVLLTEADEFIITEDGDNLALEG